MRTAVISLCLLTLFSYFANSLTLKHRTGHGGRKSVVVQNPVQRSAWECHPGCKRFCLSSCKRSCCAPGAPNYSPEMLPQLINYQASLPPPPPPAPACPTGCPSTCYPNCDAGCCFPVGQPPLYYPPNPYDAGYAVYPPGDPCAAQSCSASCAPLCKPDCCRSQALNLSIRPVYLGSKASPATSPPAAKKPTAKKSAAKKKAPPKKKQPTIDLKKLAKKTGFLCIPQCQKLCKPVCMFKCCLPTYKFPKHSDHEDSHPAPKAVHHDIKPVASPQRVPVPKLLSLPEPTEAPAQDLLQTPYAGGYQDPNTAEEMAAAATCPGTCPLSCAPSCEFSCCSPYMTQPAVPVQAFPYGAIPVNPMAPYPFLQGPPSPGLSPLTCPGQSCPDACAPLCSPSCCRGIILLPRTWDKRNTKPHAV